MRLSLLSILIFISFYSYSQQNVSTKDKKAIAFYENGRQLIGQRRFPDAILNFRQAIERDKNFVEAYLSLAKCYRTMRDEANEKYCLLSAFSIKPFIPEAVYDYFSLSSLFMREGDYKNAEIFIDRFNSYNPSDKKLLAIAKRIKENCLFAKESIETAKSVILAPLPSPVNLFQKQYFPTLTADGKTLAYTVRNSIGHIDEENIYITEKTKEGWLKPEQLSTRINTKENEGTCSISGDGKTLVYTYCPFNKGCDLYITRKVGDEWLQPSPVPGYINTSYNETHPSLSADGQTLFFTSDRPGGLGLQDIYVSHTDSTDNFVKAINLGNKINTSDYDFSPFIHANGSTLYFASSGYVGMGGSDIFMVEKLSDSTWTTPKNLGYPINTFSNEMALVLSSDFSTGYFSKDIYNGSSYNSLLYSFSAPEELKSKIKVIYLKGKIFDADTKLPLKANVELINLETRKTDQLVTSDPKNGDVLLVVQDKKNFGLFISAKGYLYQSLNLNTLSDSMSSSEDFKIYLTPIKVNSTAALRNIFFETGSYDLDQKSEIELSRLAKLIIDNKLKIEISGHTDAVGSLPDNQILSDKRAQAVYNYLSGKKKVSKLSLTYKGFGSTKPIGDNKTEEGKKQNRRIEIKILK